MIQTKQNQVNTKTHWFCSNELRLNSSLEAWVSWRVLPKSEGYRTRTLECYPLRTLETWIQSSPIQVKNLEPRGAATFPELHSKSVQSWAHRSGLIVPWAEFLFETYVCLCSPILDIWYIGLCVPISLKAILWEKKGIQSLAVPALSLKKALFMVPYSFSQVPNYNFKLYQIG